MKLYRSLNPFRRPGPKLSVETERRVRLLFRPEDQQTAASMLINGCGNNLPFAGQANEFELEQCRFAALKVSHGDLSKLERAIELAQVDFRDLVVEAGFHHSITAHETWLPEQRWSGPDIESASEPGPAAIKQAFSTDREGHSAASVRTHRGTTRRDDQSIRVGPRLSPETERRTRLLFTPEEQQTAIGLLVMLCGNNIIKRANEYELEQVRFAALKFSDGDLDRLRVAIERAEVDWRDLVRAVGFEDSKSHENWLPEKKW